MNNPFFSALLLGLLWSPSNQALTPSDIPIAYSVVASKYEVPADILYAIALTESGKLYEGSKLPWPWSLNIEGKSVYCDTRSQALLSLNDAIQQGKSVDVGLMQVSWYWHSQRFSSPEESLSPVKNLMIGASILAEQYRQSGDWWVAVGRYHDPGQDEESLQRAEYYLKKVRQNWRGSF